MHNDEQPKLEGAEAFLLRAEGMSPDTHRIYEIRWNGGTWLDEEYGVCREAAVFAERLVRDYTAYYTGEVVKEEVVGKRRKMVYEYWPERGPDSKVMLTAWYEKQKESSAYIGEKNLEAKNEKKEQNAEENSEKQAEEISENIAKENVQKDSRENKVEETVKATLAVLLFLSFFCGWISYVSKKHTG